MTQNEIGIVEQARNAVGINPVGNYKFGNLEEHIKALTEDADPLKQVLERPHIKEVISEYSRFDADAIKWQQRFKRSYRFAFGIIFLTFAASLFLLVWPMPQEWLDWLHSRAMIVLVSTLLLSLVIAWRLRNVGHYEHWHESRGNAEFLRRKHFENVIEEPTEPQSDNVPPLLLKLMYFRRYQLELQSTYHEVRGAQHERRALFARLLLLPSIALAFIWLVLVGLAWLAAYLDQGPLPMQLPADVFRILAWTEHVETIVLDTSGLLLVLMISLIYGVAMIVTRLDGNLRDAARYAVARENLSYLQDEPFQQACEAAMRSDTESVLHFVWKVHSIMANENADWVRLRNLDRGHAAAQHENPIIAN